MDSVGKLLKEIREEQDLTIEQVSEETKIKPRMIQAIEEDNLKALGGIGYGRAIITTYARFLKADVKKVLSAYDRSMNKTETVYRPPAEEQPKKILIPANIIYIIILIMLVVFLAIITVRFYREGRLSSPLPRRISPQTTETDNQTSDPDTILPEPTSLIEVTPEIDDSPLDEIDSATTSLHNRSALQDTTDYVNIFIFEGKDNPLNIKD
jgi:cytoskeletal protein RodZ